MAMPDSRAFEEGHVGSPARPEGDRRSLDAPLAIAARQGDSDLPVPLLPDGQHDRLAAVDHVQEEVLARQTGVRAGQIAGIDHDVVGKQIGEDGKSAGGLDAQAVHAAHGGRADKPLAGLDLEANHGFLAVVGSEGGIQGRHAGGDLPRGDPAQTPSLVVSGGRQHRPQGRPTGPPAVQLCARSALTQDERNAAAREHGIAAESVAGAVFGEGRPARLGRHGAGQQGHGRRRACVEDLHRRHRLVVGHLAGKEDGRLRRRKAGLARHAAVFASRFVRQRDHRVRRSAFGALAQIAYAWQRARSQRRAVAVLVREARPGGKDVGRQQGDPRRRQDGGHQVGGRPVSRQCAPAPHGCSSRCANL